MKCKECDHQVAQNAFSCPNCGAHNPTKAGEGFLKGFFIFIGAIFFALVLFMSLASANETDKNVLAAKNEIKGEQKVIDVYYDPSAAVQWHIGVYDDGSKRHGYASYICDILYEHALVRSDTSVRIVDIKRVKQGQSFRETSLGRVNCSNYQQYAP